MKYKILKFFLPPILAFALAISLNIFAFTEPTLAPPGGNVSAPLNVSSTTQTKAGILGVSALRLSGPTGWPGVYNNTGSSDGPFIELVGKDQTADLSRRGEVNIGSYSASTGNIRFFNYDPGYSWQERMRITPDGNVGIGTTLPLRKLEVKQKFDVLDEGFAVVNADNNSRLNLYKVADTSFIYSGVAGELPLVLNNTGNVGIGTTGPARKLQIDQGTETGFSLNERLFLDGSVGSTVRITNNAYVNSAGVWAIKNAAAKASTIEIRNSGVVDIYGTLTNGVTDWRQMVSIDAPNNKVIFPAGNVGIGTTSPGAKLEVANLGVSALGFRTINSAGTRNIFLVPELGGGGYNPLSQAGDSGIFYNDAGGLVIGPWSGSNKGIRIDSAGNVGIGTTGPNRKLDIGNGSDGITIGQQLDNTQSIQAYIDGQWANRTTYAGGCCNSLLLQPDVGNVGIGTTAPNANTKLDVIGVIKADSIKLPLRNKFLAWAGSLSYGTVTNECGPGQICLLPPSPFCASSTIGQLRAVDDGTTAWICFCGKRGGVATEYCW